MGENPESVLYVDHIEQHGRALFEEACKRDLEGVVAKPLRSPYRNIQGKSPWIKIRNRLHVEGRPRRSLQREAMAAPVSPYVPAHTGPWVNRRSRLLHSRGATKNGALLFDALRRVVSHPRV